MCVSKKCIIVASKYKKISTLVYKLKYPILKINWFAFKIKNKDNQLETFEINPKIYASIYY